MTKKTRIHRFYNYMSMGAFCCHGNHSFVPICPKTKSSVSPSQKMLLIKFDYNWPAGLGDIFVRKCGRRRTMTDDDGRRRTTEPCYTISSPFEKKHKITTTPGPFGHAGRCWSAIGQLTIQWRKKTKKKKKGFKTQYLIQWQFLPEGQICPVSDNGTDKSDQLVCIRHKNQNVLA